MDTGKFFDKVNSDSRRINMSVRKSLQKAKKPWKTWTAIRKKYIDENTEKEDGPLNSEK